MRCSLLCAQRRAALRGRLAGSAARTRPPGTGGGRVPSTQSRSRTAARRSSRSKCNGGGCAPTRPSAVSGCSAICRSTWRRIRGNRAHRRQFRLDPSDIRPSSRACRPTTSRRDGQLWGNLCTTGMHSGARCLRSGAAASPRSCSASTCCGSTIPRPRRRTGQCREALPRLVTRLGDHSGRAAARCTGARLRRAKASAAVRRRGSRRHHARRGRTAASVPAAWDARRAVRLRRDG